MKETQKQNEAPVPFETIKSDEIEAVKAYRCGLKGISRPFDSEIDGDPVLDLRGIALSGGGIRSATFALGVLQAFATDSLLPSIDVISAVSGGGYIASWLAELVYQLTFQGALMELKIAAGKRASPEIQHLRRHSSYLTPRLGILSHDVTFLIVTYLQNLCFNLLVIGLLLCVVMLMPRLLLWMVTLAARGPSIAGVAGTTLGVGAVMILLLRLLSFRGEVLPARTHKLLMTVHSLIVVCVVLLPHFAPKFTTYDWVFPAAALMLFFWPRLAWKAPGTSHAYSAERFTATGVLLLFFGCVELSGAYPEWRLGIVLAAVWARQAERSWETQMWSHRRRMITIAIPAVFGIFLAFSRIFFAPPPVVMWDLHFNFATIDRFLGTRPVWLTTAVLVASAVSLAGWLWYLAPDRVARHFTRLHDKRIVTFPLASGLVAMVLLYSCYRGQEIIRLIGFLKASRLGNAGAFIHVFVFVAPASIIAATFVANLIVAIAGRVFPAHKQERVTEISSKIYIYSLFWMCIASLALYFPLVLYTSPTTVHYILFGLWICAVASGFTGNLWLRRLPSAIAPLLRLMHTALPYVFLLGFMALCSWLLDISVFRLSWPGNYYLYMLKVYGTFSPAVLVMAAVAAALSAALAARFGINMSSMHVFYRARLAQAFLQEELPGGGSLRTARPVQSTRAALRRTELRNLEDLVPAEGAYDGPYLILNAAMNLGSSKELAWQERKAANFILSPLYCGFLVRDSESAPPGKKPGVHPDAYCRTAAFGYGGATGLRLAMAMAISGSALGSNMGRFTSAGRRFMNTVFNLRLGWWLNNPRYPESWASSMSRARLRMLMAELLGSTSDSGPFVNLSDGGHFDNSGLYELVQRHCRAIIVVDASADAGGTMTSLANAVELCRTDFGAEINIDIRPLLATNAEARADGAFVVGTITYSHDETGYIAYLKARAIGVEPVDVWNYGRLHAAFPNESTANQWFHESQFESYRELGFRIGTAFARALRRAQGNTLVDRLKNLVLKEPEA